ncbi:hypothetical protein [Paenibacillus thalictri]|nr:hypothetical protein [Paenibacillus thalictri]
MAFKLGALATSAAVILLMMMLISSPSESYAQNATNLALNPAGTGYPQVSASYTCGCDNVWSIVNGIQSYTENPRDRWTNYGSPNTSDTIDIQFGAAASFNQVKLYIYDDHGGVQPPASYEVQYWNGNAWTGVTNPIKNPAIPAAYLNTVNFDTVFSSKLRIVITNSSQAYSGLVELEVFLGDTAADNNAASAVMTAIGQLPERAAVTLADKPAIAAARTAYEQLTAYQKNLVTNLGKLTEAEAAISEWELYIIPGGKDPGVLSAFSDAAGYSATVTLSSVLNATYGVQAGKFMAAGSGATATSAVYAVYAAIDSNLQTIKVTFPAPVFLNDDDVTLSFQGGAMMTANNEPVNGVRQLPVIPFGKLDLSHDGRIGIEDIVLMLGNPVFRLDLNRDGTFDRDDVLIFMRQISPYSR